MKKIFRHSIFALSLAPVLFCAEISAATITMQTDQPGVAINRGMWGIFF